MLMIARGSTSTTLKVLGAGLLVLLSMIPLTMVSSIVSERAGRRNSVLATTAASWGGQQALGGVTLTVPFDQTVRIGDRLDTSERLARFLPETLRIDAELTPEIRRRSIFPVIVYRVRARVAGAFATPDLSRLVATPGRVQWDRARISLDVRDMRGVTEVAPLVWAGRPVPLEPDGPDGAYASGLGAVVALATVDGAPDPSTPRLPFSIDVMLAGTEHLAFTPSGGTTEVKLRSPWPHPSFAGAFLPETHQVDARGFTASWRILSFARAYPQAWLAGQDDVNQQRLRVAPSEFGVTLVQTADVYQQTERAVKYGLLFVLLTFTIFFLWELLRAMRLHPIQYALVGMALVVFYLLLLSISEHLPFPIAYLAASTATIVLVAGYSGFILAAGARGGLAIGSLLTGLYGVLYVLLQLEDLALLVGAIGVFLALAAVMYLTRRVNWYDTLSRTAPAGSGSEPIG
jgi:inner membrane protein